MRKNSAITEKFNFKLKFSYIFLSLILIFSICFQSYATVLESIDNGSAWLGVQQETTGSYGAMIDIYPIQQLQ